MAGSEPGRDFKFWPTCHAEAIRMQASELGEAINVFLTGQDGQVKESGFVVEAALAISCAMTGVNQLQILSAKARLSPFSVEGAQLDAMAFGRH